MTAKRVYTDAEVDAIVATHTAIAAAHHVKYTDAEVDAIVATHTAIGGAHHSKYTDAEAVSAVDTADKYVKNDGDRITGNFELWAVLKTDQWLEDLTNTFLGVNVAGAGNLEHTTGDEGYGNIGLGNAALYAITKGARNLGIGTSALTSITTGGNNMGLGYAALYYNVIGDYNVGVGSAALMRNTGNNNIGIGRSSGLYQQAGNNNVFIGYQSGMGTALHTKSGCVNIGYEAGKNDNSSNKLYIHYSASATPLIYGEFDNTILKINGYLYITSILSGATQAAAGASVGEVWKTSGHATLPDNVLMIGV